MAATVNNPEIIGRKLPYVSTLKPPPSGWKQIIRHSESDGFLKATKIDWNTLTQKKTFEMITINQALRPEEQYQIKSLPLKWVFTYKQYEEGRLLKHKARICVRGDLYRSTRDTFAATLAVSTFRALMALLAACDIEMISLDAVNAFLNSALDEVVVCGLPPGFEMEGKKIRLQRALYGLPRSPLLWAQTVEKELRKLEFTKVSGVDCLMFDGVIYCFYFFDDFIAIALPQHKSKLDKFKSNLMDTFQMRECDENRFPGIRLIRNCLERKVWLLQGVYITKMAIKHELDHVTKTITPLYVTYGRMPDPDDKLSDSSRASPDLIQEYQSNVGSIGHASIFTRPDVARSFSLLAEHLSNPIQDDLQSANRCIQYLFSTRYLALLYHGIGGSVENFNGASDAAIADDSQTRRSPEAYLFRLFGGPIAWVAKKQPTVAKSTMESELAALSRAGSHQQWWERFFRSVQFNPEQGTLL
ncbi:hypothetical protein K3495_g7345 [Podosphaera aphanis]|nr:hypothetical protein K3495_g7345 [Podosphaera aphanis]